MNHFPNISNFFTALRSYAPWQVAIELLLIGTVVYYVLEFLRGTRGARMLRGIALVLITLYVLVQFLAVLPPIRRRAENYTLGLHVLHRLADAVGDGFPLPLRDGSQHVQDQLAARRARVD